jgi:hypothetical protein
MRDVIVVVIIAVFFTLCVAYVRWCDRIIGPDPDDLRDDDVHEPTAEGEANMVDVAAAAGATPVDGGAFDAEAVRS